MDCGWWVCPYDGPTEDLWWDLGLYELRSLTPFIYGYCWPSGILVSQLLAGE